jgi:Ca2+-binding RTX toxin-like protein
MAITMTHLKTASSFVFIDASVENYSSLAEGALGANVHILDSTRDGIAQITKILTHVAKGDKAIAPVDSIHIVSHGAPGCLYLGNTPLNLDTLDRYASDLRTWFSSDKSLSEPCSSPSLLLYGCNVAAGDAGAELIDRLHKITGAEIAASSTLTGSAVLGGNWQLEVQTGAVAAIAFDAVTRDRYSGVLVAVKPGDITLTGDVINDPTSTAASPKPKISNVSWSMSNQLGNNSGLPNSGTGNFSPGFGVGSAGLATGASQSPGVTSGLSLYINNKIFVASDTADLTGQTLTVNGNSKFAGLDVSVQYSAFQDKPVMRTFASFTNSTNAAITTTVTWVTNLGNGPSSEVKAISDKPNLTATFPQYDGVFTKDSRWVIVDDDDRINGFANPEVFGNGGGSNAIRPASTDVLFGPGNPLAKPTSVSGTTFVAAVSAASNRTNNTQGILANYRITIPANSTRSLLFFYGLNTTTTQAKAAVGVFDDVTALKNTGNLVGLTSKQLSETLNWQLTSPGVTVTPTTGLQTTEVGGTANFTVVLNSQPTADVTINLTSSAPTEGKVPASVTFSTANWFTPQTVTVQGVDDKVKDGNVAYTIQTKSASADTAYTAIDPADVSILNIDNETTPTSTPTPTPDPRPIPGPTPNTPLLLLKGTNRANQLKGTASNDKLLGYGGNDRLVGNDGDDSLDGGKNTDILLGGNGSDALKGGRDTNYLSGGADQDVFVVETGGTQIIRDFQNTGDKLGLSGKLKFKDLEIVKSGRNTVIREDGDVLAVLQGIKPSLISSADFVKI